MKKTIIALIFITVAFSQWVTVAPKPPVEMKQLNINMNYWHEQVSDSLGVIPDSFKVDYDVMYRIFMYDEDGRIVGNDQTQGDLTQFMTVDEKLWIKAFLDKYGTLAIGLLP